MCIYSILQAVHFTKRSMDFSDRLGLNASRIISCFNGFGQGFKPLCLKLLICKRWQRKLSFWGGCEN